MEHEQRLTLAMLTRPASLVIMKQSNVLPYSSLTLTARTRTHPRNFLRPRLILSSPDWT